MITDVIALEPYTVLVEQSHATHPTAITCKFEDDAIGFAFYGSANVRLSVSTSGEPFQYNNTSGSTISFFANANVAFTHHIASDRPLQCVTVFIKKTDIKSLPAHERAIFGHQLEQLVESAQDFVNGPP